MKPNSIKKLLFSEIKSVSSRFADFCMSAGKDFTRNRKISFETVLKTIIGMESSSLTNELIDAFGISPDMPSASAFIQQRNKVKAEAFKAVFDGFTVKATDFCPITDGIACP